MLTRLLFFSLLLVLGVSGCAKKQEPTPDTTPAFSFTLEGDTYAAAIAEVIIYSDAAFNTVEIISEPLQLSLNGKAFRGYLTVFFSKPTSAGFMGGQVGKQHTPVW